MDSSSFVRVVANMMARYGGAASVVIVSKGTYDVETSSVPTTETQYAVKAMVFDYTLQSNGSQTEKNSLIQTGDKQVFVQPTDDVPALSPEKDFVVIGTKRYRIITYKELNPAQSGNILMELFVRV